MKRPEARKWVQEKVAEKIAEEKINWEKEKAQEVVEKKQEANSSAIVPRNFLVNKEDEGLYVIPGFKKPRYALNYYCALRDYVEEPVVLLIKEPLVKFFKSKSWRVASAMNAGLALKKLIMAVHSDDTKSSLKYLTDEQDICSVSWQQDKIPVGMLVTIAAGKAFQYLDSLQTSFLLKFNTDRYTCDYIQRKIAPALAQAKQK